MPNDSQPLVVVKMGGEPIYVRFDPNTTDLTDEGLPLGVHNIKDCKGGVDHGGPVILIADKKDLKVENIATDLIIGVVMNFSWHPSLGCHVHFALASNFSEWAEEARTEI
ncbi:unnamed protein product [Ostreobium quekettii]|uniref:Uncharacterized protein n=1 Tax=Ostreobium quekettii TaxID=121088 RepID=A0A8S1IN79_9CHLO|nr:unnamed protein product [Ostreobium quekettii]